MTKQIDPYERKITNERLRGYRWRQKELRWWSWRSTGRWQQNLWLQ